MCCAGRRVLSCWHHFSLSLPFCPGDEPGPHLKPCSSEASPNYRALGGLLFIAVKALTPYCAAVSGWIQHRTLLCRPQLFYAWVGWLGGSGSGHIFQICLDGLTISLFSVFSPLTFSSSVMGVVPSHVVSVSHKPSLLEFLLVSFYFDIYSGFAYYLVRRQNLNIDDLRLIFLLTIISILFQ